MDLVWTKVVVLVLLGVIRLFFGLIPLRITNKLKLWGESGLSVQLIQQRHFRIDMAISLCLCFGGGILLATCFIHMLPEVRESLDAVKHSDTFTTLVARDSTFPLAEFLICCGFFLVYIIEEVAHRLFVHSSSTKTPPSNNERPLSSNKVDHLMMNEDKLTVAVVGTERFSFRGEDLNEVLAPVSISSRTMPKSGGSKIAPASSQTHLISSSLSLEQGSNNNRTIKVVDGLATSVSQPLNCHPCDNDRKAAAGEVPPHHHHGGFALDSLKEGSLVGNLRSFLVVLALSFHSVFEGLAIGLQQTNRDVWYLFTAVSIHACAILFCIGLELVTSGVKLFNFVLYIVTLAIVSPLGVAVGIIVAHSPLSTEEESSVEQMLAVAVLQGIAGGTILYITFFEVLDREKRKETGCGIVRIIFILAGFFVMVALQAIGAHDHGGLHGEPEHHGSYNHSHVHHH